MILVLLPRFVSPTLDPPSPARNEQDSLLVTIRKSCLHGNLSTVNDGDRIS